MDEEFDNTIEMDCLKCPYCGLENTDAWEINFNDDKIEIDCECGKKFWGERVVTVDYRGNADCKLNNQEHNLVSTGLKSQFKCKICGEYVHEELTASTGVKE